MKQRVLAGEQFISNSDLAAVYWNPSLVPLKPPIELFMGRRRNQINFFQQLQLERRLVEHSFGVN